jgi:Flp pilus assembly protein TadG
VATCLRRLHGLRTAPEGQRGSVSLEIGVLGPALLLLVFSIVQAGLWFYARSLAFAAAQEGVNAARAYGADPGAGVVRAKAFLEEQAGDSLTNTTATSVGSTPTVIRIQVTGRSVSVLPGVPGIQVTQSATGTVERFTTDVNP